MSSAQSSSASRILAYFQGNHTVVASDAPSKFGITPHSFRARVAELKKAGYPVYGNRFNGNEVIYRLGSPSRRVIAAGNFLLGTPGLAKRYAKTIDANLSLV
jgi:hypothetical protein